MVYNVYKFKNHLKNLKIDNFKDKNLEEISIKEKKHQKKTLFIDSDIEIVLIVWPPNYETGIHSHPDGGCISKCLDNCLLEKRFSTKTLEIIGSNSQNKDDISYIDNSLYYHQIVNNSDKISYSLHIYSPPNYYIKNRNISI